MTQNPPTAPNPTSPPTEPHENSEPAVRFRHITFSDGKTIELDSGDVVVFVGPNNAGKSLALRDLQQRITRPGTTRVVTATTADYSGTVGDVTTYVKKHARENEQSPGNYSGYGFSIHLPHLSNYWKGTLQNLAPLFCKHLDTISRITGSDPATSIDVLNEAPSHPIHMLYQDDALERAISGYFARAFGENLIVYRCGGRVVPLLVGSRLSPSDGESPVSTAYCERQREVAVPLTDQGDGMRAFATVILHLLAPATPSILLLDEPEAFLHPPQARLLGQLIAQHRSSRAQLFVATHSADVLNGLLQVIPDKLRLLRIRRKANTNYVTELDKEHAEQIGGDTLMRYSSVLSGVFFDRVVICESDSDCLFYSSLLELPEICGKTNPSAHFLHGGGKSRLAPLARALTRLDVPVDVIADVDVVRDTVIFRDIVQSVNGDWGLIESLVKRVQGSVAKRGVPETKGRVGRVRALLENLNLEDELPETARAELHRETRRATPWSEMKKSGRASIPRGQETEEFDKLCRLCGEMGLWIVPVGEMEGFHRAIGGHGPDWVRRVIEKCDLASDPELTNAREFVSSIWTRTV